MSTRIGLKEADSLIRKYVDEECIKELVNLLKAKAVYDGDVKAAIYLLDRVGGKPVQGIMIDESSAPITIRGLGLQPKPNESSKSETSFETPEVTK